MELSLGTAIFLFFICLCGGIVIGVIFGRFRNLSLKNPRGNAEKEVAREQVSPLQSSLGEPGKSGVMQACIDSEGNTWLEFGGQRLDNRQAMQKNQHELLSELDLKIHAWLGVPSTPGISLPALPVKHSRVASRKPIFSKSKIPPRVSGDQPHPSGPVSIVDQVESILQRKLAGTGYEDKNIHILEGRAGEVLVQIGQERFIGVDAVMDAGIKDLIRKAVAEWENGLH